MEKFLIIYVVGDHSYNLGRPMTLVSVIHIVPLKIEPAPGMPTQANQANASVTDIAQFLNGT